MLRLRGGELTIDPRPLSGRVVLPSSKSETHRAILLAARAASPSRIHRPLRADDTLASREAVEAMGATVEELGADWRITPAALRPPDHPIDCGNSGTTLRLMMGQAALLPATVAFDGDRSLRRRSSAPLLAALGSLGARSESEDGCPPLSLRGPIRGGDVTVDSAISSQFASSLVLALPFAEGDSTLHLAPPVRSRPYLDMTLRMARAVGLRYDLEPEAAGGLCIRIPGGQHFDGGDMVIGADWSSAALIAVAAVLSGGSVTMDGLDADSPQGDRVLVELLERFGLHVRRSDGLAVAAAPLRSPGVVDLSQCPDLFPPLCALAACTPGQTVLAGSPGLRRKECDRIAAMAACLAAAGIPCQQREDGLVIEGGKPRPVKQHCFDDHRVHMALAALAMAAEGASVLDGAWSTTVSFPDFHRMLDSLA